MTKRTEPTPYEKSIFAEYSAHPQRYNWTTARDLDLDHYALRRLFYLGYVDRRDNPHDKNRKLFRLRTPGEGDPLFTATISITQVIVEQVRAPNSHEATQVAESEARRLCSLSKTPDDDPAIVVHLKRET